MKKFLTVLATCSLALAVSALAENENAAKGKAKKQAQPAQHAPKQAHVNPGQVHAAHVAKPARNTAELAPKPKAVHHERVQTNVANPKHTPKSNVATQTNAVTNGKPNGAGKNKKLQQQKAAESAAIASKPATNNATATQSLAATNVANGQKNQRGARKVDPQVVQKIKSEHANFKAQPQPEKIPAVSYNQNYRIKGADQWQGAQYQTFRSYHPERHDRGWYSSHYSRVEIIGGGAYFWNNGYWYPAWGYDPSAEYYPYDGPIYVGSHAEPPDRVIADVQAVLQEQGYYRGEVDGLLGPLTREALRAYQADNGLYTTAALDEPTLDSLGMG